MSKELSRRSLLEASVSVGAVLFLSSCTQQRPLLEERDLRPIKTEEVKTYLTPIQKQLRDAEFGLKLDREPTNFGTIKTYHATKNESTIKIVPLHDAIDTMIFISTVKDETTEVSYKDTGKSWLIYKRVSKKDGKASTEIFTTGEYAPLQAHVYGDLKHHCSEVLKNFITL